MKQKLSDYSYEVKRRGEQRILGIVLFCVIVVLGITLIRSFLIFSVRQRSASMNPDIAESSLVFFTPIVGNLSRGDVVLLRPRISDKLPILKRVGNACVKFFSGQQYAPYDSKKMYEQGLIRRVVALPYDTIYMKDNILFVRPKGEKHFLTEHEVSKKIYNLHITKSLPGWDNDIGVQTSFSEIILGENEYFVLADNRLDFIDSRLWGNLSVKEIAAKGVLIYFPFSKFKLL